MERNFNIDKSYLNEILNNLREYSFDKDALLDSFRLELIINRYNSKFSNDDGDNLRSLISDDLESYQFYKPLYPIIESFVINGYSLEDLDYKANYTGIALSNCEAFSLVKDFFGEQGEFFYSGFSEFDEEADDHLEFINSDANTDGEMLFLKSTGDAFLFIPDNKNLTKALILVHEIEHAIDSFKNMNFYENTLIRETSAIFMEMIAGDYFAKRYGLFPDNDKRKLSLHFIIKEQANIVIDKIDMLDIIANNSELNDEELFSILESEGYSRRCVEFLMENSIMQDFYYLIPQLIAIELYFIYSQDRRLALRILEDIIMNGTDKNILELISNYGIVLNKNVQRYEDKLLNKVKKQ